MPKKLWIQDIENAQKLFYELKKRAVIVQDCCDDNCDFLEVHFTINSCCWLFSQPIKNNKRCKECKEMFGEE